MAKKTFKAPAKPALAKNVIDSQKAIVIKADVDESVTTSTEPGILDAGMDIISTDTTGLEIEPLSEINPESGDEDELQDEDEYVEEIEKPIRSLTDCIDKAEEIVTFLDEYRTSLVDGGFDTKKLDRLNLGINHAGMMKTNILSFRNSLE